VFSSPFNGLSFAFRFCLPLPKTGHLSHGLHPLVGCLIPSSIRISPIVAVVSFCRDPERAALVADGVRQLNAVKMPVLEQRVTPAALSETYFYDRLDGMDKATAAKFFRLLKEVCSVDGDHTVGVRLPQLARWSIP
jgi:hypothetical protein